MQDLNYTPMKREKPKMSVLTANGLDKEHIKALSKSFGICAKDLLRDISEESYKHYGLTVYACNGGEYAIGTDDEANEAAKEYIQDTLWAFNASFLAGETDLPEEVFEALSARFEDSNSVILKIIKGSCGIEDFVESAISADGRGHFLSSYDGNENEETVNGFTHYIYRVN